MKIFSLVLTNNLNKIRRNENLISIRPIENELKIYDLRFDKDFNDIKRQEVLRRYKFCENVFNKLLLQIKRELNKLHNVKYSSRAWEIIIGIWLRDFVHLSYKIYLDLNYVFKKYRLKKIYLINQTKYSLTVDDSISQKNASMDGEWFYSVCSYIAENLSNNNKIIKTIPKRKRFLENKKKTPSGNNHISTFKKIIFKLISLGNYLSKLNNNAFIINTYLPFIQEKKLEIKLCQFPTLWKQKKISYKKIDKEKRACLNFQRSKNKFENILLKNLFNFLPKYTIENFKELNELQKKIYPQKPKFIFTSSSYAYDEAFKLYVANQVEDKTSYFIGQHGNQYFSRIHNTFLTELNTPDKFISWGAKDKPNVIKGFNFKTLNTYNSFGNNKKLLIIFEYLNETPFTLHNTDQEKINHIKNMIEIIKNLSPEIKKNTIIRLTEQYYKNNCGTKYYNFFKNLGVEIDNGEKNIDELIKKAKLVFFSYESSGVLENFITNKPTIFFVEENFFNSIHKNYINKYKILLRNNIMFSNKKKLINHINKNWDRFDKLWSSKEKQNSIKKFNKNFNIKSNNNDLNNLKKIFIKNNKC